MINLSIANKVFMSRLEPLCENKARKEINILVTKIVNDEIIKYEDNSLLVYNDVSSSLMECIDFDTFSLNKMSNNLINKLNNSLFEIDDGEYLFNNNKNILTLEIPYGVINNNSLLSNMGPMIPFSIKFSGDSFCNVDCVIDDFSINTIMIKVVLKVLVNFMVYIPFKSKNLSVNIDYPIAMKLIQGSIPDIYLGSYPITSGGK